MKTKSIISKARTCKKNVEKLQKLGVSDDMAYYFAKVILGSKTEVKDLKIKSPSEPVGDHISRQIPKDDYIDMIKRLVDYVEKSKTGKQMPNYITYKNLRIEHKLYTYFISSILVTSVDIGYLPKQQNITSKIFTKKTESTNNILAYFIKKFGKVTTFTEALRKIHNKGYGFYFDDKLSNIQVIDGLSKSNGVKPNCVDICHMMWHVAKGLGYDVRCLHVYCPVDKITHVRLQVKHAKWTNGKWESYDPAAVAKGNSINTLWCSGKGSYVIATNPNWFMQNLNK